MFKKLTLFFAALTLSVGLFAKTSVITYTAAEKLPETTDARERGLHLNAFFTADSTQLTVTHTFDKAEGVGTITLDGEVAIIGYRAISGCGFTSIDLPASINQIGIDAFRDCDYMESIAIPEAVTVISQNAFYGCTILTTVTMGNNVTIIGTSAFRDCRKLASITWPSALEEIGAHAFRGTGFTSVELPQSVKKIGSDAFHGSKLTTFVFPEDLDTIPNEIFNECDALVSVTLPLNVKHIGDIAFGAGPKLTTISLPATVESLGMGAFYNNPFTSITCAALVPPTCGDMCFEEVNKDIPVYVPEGTVELYKAADGWKDFTCFNTFDPTALPTLFGDGVKANKFMHNGQVIIRKDNKTYNTLGAELK